MSKRPTTAHEPVLIADGTYIVPCSSENRVSIGLSSETEGTISSGTLTFRGRLQGEEDFQPLVSESVINFESYASITIYDASLEALEVTALGVAGTGLGTEIKLALNAV